MNEPVIIHGPQGCGKSARAEALKSEFGAQRIVDEWRPGQHLAPGDLALTNVAPPLELGFDARVIPFSAVVGHVA